MDTDAEWWTLDEVAERWKTSAATVRRLTKLPATHARHLRSLSVGAKARVHLTELVRYEAVAKPQATKADAPKKPAVSAAAAADFRQLMQQAKQRRARSDA